MSRAIRFRKVVVGGAIVVIVVLLGNLGWTYLWPYVDRGLFKAGATCSIAVSDVHIGMSDPWYCLMSSEQGIGKLLLRTTRPTTVAKKLPDGNPAEALIVSISKLNDDEAQKLKQPGAHVTELRRYPWGSAFTMGAGGAVFLPDFGIVISDDGRAKPYVHEVLKDIRSISRSANR